MSHPYMPLYMGDYHRDTAHLSTVEHGAYLLLLMHYFAFGQLFEDDDRLARIVRLPLPDWLAIKPIIQAFFYDGWRHKRVEYELLKHRVASDHGKRAAEARWRKTKRAPDMPEHNPGICPSDASIPYHTKKEREGKEDTADAVSPAKLYAFESGVIRLCEKDLQKWKTSFAHLDLEAELLSLTQWAGEQENWFFAVSGALAKRNRQERGKIEQAKISPNGARNGNDRKARWDTAFAKLTDYVQRGEQENLRDSGPENAGLLSDGRRP